VTGQLLVAAVLVAIVGAFLVGPYLIYAALDTIAAKARHHRQEHR
jgi:hypothetical protein